MVQMEGTHCAVPSVYDFFLQCFHVVQFITSLPKHATSAIFSLKYFLQMFLSNSNVTHCETLKQLCN